MGISDAIKSYKGLPRSIYVLFFASIVNNMGNFVNPFLTIFLKDNLGMNASTVGTFVMAASILGLLGSICGGKLIDFIGRKKILIIFQGLAALCYLSGAFLIQSNILPWILICAGFFYGVASPVFSTIITDMTRGEERKVAFSLTYLAMNIGFAVGPLVAGFLYENYLIWIFIGDAITTFISILLVGALVPESKPTKEEMEKSKVLNSDNERAEEGSLLVALSRRPNLVIFSFITVIYFFIFSQFTFGLPIQVTDLFGQDLGTKVYGVLMTTNAVGVVALTTLITVLTKRFRPVVNMTYGGLFYAIGFGMMFLINSIPMFILSAIIWTIGEIFIATNTSIYIANHTPMSHRGRFNSVFPIVRKIGFALGPKVTGEFIDIYGIRLMWVLIFGTSLIASALMYSLYIAERKKAQVANP